MPRKVSKVKAKSKKQEKKPASRRSKVKYPALRTEYNLKTRAEHIDFDYINKLNDKEKEWLNLFVEEYVNASFKPKGKGKRLHKTDALRRDCYNRNNYRNRDIMSRKIATGELDKFGDLSYVKEVVKTDAYELLEKRDNLKNSFNRSDNSDDSN